MASKNGGDSLGLDEGYPKDIFIGGNIDEKFLCNFCGKVLKEPVQSFCGHRFCKACIDRNIKSGQPIQCSQCRNEDNDDDYSTLQPDQVFPDRAVYREMARLKVKCLFPDCPWTGIFKQLEEHLKDCKFKPMKCDDCGNLVTLATIKIHAEKDCPQRIINCKHCKANIKFAEQEQHNSTCEKYPLKCDACGKKKIPRENMQNHIDNDCTNQKMQCPAGCGSFDKSNYLDHLMTGPAVHLALAMGELSILKKDISKLHEGLSIKFSELEGRVDAQAPALAQDSIQNIEAMVDRAVQNRHQNFQENLKTVEVKAGTFEGIANSLHREVDKTITALENLERHRRIAATEKEELINKIKSLERTIALKDIAIAEQDLRIQSLESASYDGSFIWKITDFSKKQQEASQTRSISIYSPAFYTSHHGYKACARLYPNGDGMGKGTHLSLFFVVMRGQYDALQQWPFKQRVTFCLVNQNGGEHILDSFRPDPSSSSFKRPSSDMNIASGCPLFMRLDTVNNPANGFLRDDVMYIKISVDVNDLRDPLSHPDDRIKVVPVDAH